MLEFATNLLIQLKLAFGDAEENENGATAVKVLSNWPNFTNRVMHWIKDMQMKANGRNALAKLLFKKSNP